MAQEQTFLRYLFTIVYYNVLWNQTRVTLPLQQTLCTIRSLYSSLMNLNLGLRIIILIVVVCKFYFAFTHGLGLPCEAGFFHVFYCSGY